jgi:hypothetical protein
MHRSHQLNLHTLPHGTIDKNLSTCAEVRKLRSQGLLIHLIQLFQDQGHGLAPSPSQEFSDRKKERNNEGLNEKGHFIIKVVWGVSPTSSTENSSSVVVVLGGFPRDMRDLFDHKHTRG